MNVIHVTFDTHAPDEWNTPVPVEVFDDAMRRVGEPHVFNLAHGGTIDVDRAGRYYVMATLPNGESVGASVDVAATGDSAAAAVLVPAESSPSESLAWAFTRQRLPREREVPRRQVPAAPGGFELGSDVFADFTDLGPVTLRPPVREQRSVGVPARGADIFEVPRRQVPAASGGSELGSEVFTDSTDLRQVTLRPPAREQKSAGVPAPGADIFEVPRGQVPAATGGSELGSEVFTEFTDLRPVTLRPPAREQRSVGVPEWDVDVLGMGDRREWWTLEPASDQTTWNADVQGADPRLLGQLTIARLPFVPVDPSELDHRSTRWYPLFIRYRARSRRGARLSTLVAVPAGQALGGSQRPDSVVLFVRADAVSSDAPPVQVMVSGARAQAETLLSYFEHGVLTAVHQLGARVVEESVALLERKLEDPFGAAIAGYVLLRTAARPQEQRVLQGWMRNLANWFPRIPDGAVIHGASLLRGEDVENDPARVAEARSYLLEAVARGIPTYTMGLRLLFDTLRSLAEKRQDDAELAAALARVRFVAAYADWTAQTTTLTYPYPPLPGGGIEIPG
ncbi:MAG TPA: hypothetical protein VHG32_06040 [Thermoanaerobaculia bacterium]|jgi:hypothetical protein|nr:hypothetical protein [Thermoanaerobaculia bacterium]